MEHNTWHIVAAQCTSIGPLPPFFWSPFLFLRLHRVQIDGAHPQVPPALEAASPSQFCSHRDLWTSHLCISLLYHPQTHAVPGLSSLVWTPATTFCLP